MEGRRPEGECGKFSYKKEKVALKESMQNVSLSGERGGPSKMVESRILYVGIRESMQMFLDYCNQAICILPLIKL